jgi:hypothetical protein
MFDDTDNVIDGPGTPIDMATFRQKGMTKEKEAGRSGLVRILMLQNGMTIIGTDYAEKNGVVYIRNPIMIAEQLIKTPQGPQMNLQLMPFMGFAAGPIYDFNKTLLVSIMPAKKEVEAAYHEAAQSYFGTIVPVPANAMPHDADILPFLRK